MNPTPAQAKKQHSIRTKISVIVVASIVMLISALYAVSTFLLENSYSTIEESSVTQNVQRSNDAIENYIEGLDVKLNDWSDWSSMYQFGLDRDMTFADENMQVQALINLKINMILILSPEGEVVFARTIDLAKGEDVPSDEVVKEVTANKSLLHHEETASSHKGIILLPKGMFFISSRPILNGSSEGPIVGTILFGRYLDAEMLETFRRVTHLTIDTFPYAGDVPSDVAGAKAELGPNKHYTVASQSEEKISGYTILNDINAIPISIMRIEMPRDIYTQGQRTLLFFIIATGLALLIFGIVILGLIEKYVISRFARLTDEVTQIGSLHDLSLRVTAGINDEVGILATTINKMLVELSLAQKNERAAQEKEREASRLEKQAVIQLKERLFEIERTNKYIVDREMKLMSQQNQIAKLQEQITGTGGQPHMPADTPPPTPPAASFAQTMPSIPSVSIPSTPVPMPPSPMPPQPPVPPMPPSPPPAL